MLRKKYAALLLFAVLLLCGCTDKAQADPYAGMVQVESGYGAKMWVKLHEDIPASDLAAEDFSSGVYTGTDYFCLGGIDVSEHQADIDWQAVAGSGVEFAIIRAGYRGYSQGGLFEDAYFRANIEGAYEAGLDVGIYFFSQATSAQEAEEEAEFLLSLLEDYPGAVSLPVFFDWETIGVEQARTDGVDGATLTDCAIAFCQRIEQAGYEAGIYFYRNLGYFSYDLPRLTDYTWWAATLGEAPDFYYRHSFWQYSVTGTVDGISGDVDRNMMFIPAAPEKTDAKTAADTNGQA